MVSLMNKLHNPQIPAISSGFWETFGQVGLRILIFRDEAPLGSDHRIAHFASGGFSKG
jgi:hypothetical protein